MLVQDSAWECRAKAQTQRVDDCDWWVNKRDAVARAVERHGEEVSTTVSRRANEHQSGALELHRQVE